MTRSSHEPIGKKYSQTISHPFRQEEEKQQETETDKITYTIFIGRVIYPRIETQEGIKGENMDGKRGEKKKRFDPDRKKMPKLGRHINQTREFGGMGMGIDKM